MKKLLHVGALVAVVNVSLFVLAGAQAGPVTETEVFKADAAQPQSRIKHRVGNVKESLRIELPAPAKSPVAAPSRRSGNQAAQPSIGPRQIGFGRDLPGEYGKVLDTGQLTWNDLGDGVRGARLSIKSETAVGVRVGMLVYRMPNPVLLRFFDAESTSAQVFEVTGADINASLDRDRAVRDPDSTQPLLYWSPAVDSATLGVEIILPNGVNPTDLVIAMPRLSHFFTSAANDPSDHTLGVGDSQACTLDYSCYRNNWDDVGVAVARMIFTVNGSSFLCTGTLVNDLDPTSQIPYFLTARHCISEQNVASSLQTYWFYRSRHCGIDLLSTDVFGMLYPNLEVRHGGATLLVDIEKTDTSLLRLNVPPPDGTNLLGWDTNQVARRISIVGISHPAGDMKRISFGETRGYGTCYLPPNPDSAQIFCSPFDDGNYILLSYKEGMVEGGSSGSALIDPRSRKVIGTLTGSNASCDNPELDVYYGRFDVAYQEGLQHWLGQTGSCMVPPGSWAYCNNPACGPCDVGEGDCDSDAECGTGLVCSRNVGADYGFPSTTDVCQTPDSAPPAGACEKPIGSWEYCSDPLCGPCDTGEGDCDSNAECKVGLACLDDEGATYGFPATVDVCGTPPTGACTLPNGDWGLCSDPLCGPCSAGQGDCDSNAECKAGLACLFNTGAKYGLPDAQDVCDVPVASTCNRSVGDWQYCQDPACGPCTEGQGDCENNAECAPGLSCRSNVGEQFGLPANMDVCMP